MLEFDESLVYQLVVSVDKFTTNVIDFSFLTQDVKRAEARLRLEKNTVKIISRYCFNYKTNSDLHRL